MNYAQTLGYLFKALPMYQRIGKSAYKSDLTTTIEIDKHFGQPHKAYKTIHVAGTNGKGSVSHMLASILQEAGYKTGLYTSPHLKDFRERVKVNGEMVSQDYVVDFVNDHKEIFEKHQASFFEMTVALAFQYFKEQQVDVAIIEVGMGGRLDSTNIISPILSIITNIGLDHTHFLGNTLQEIATEKAGIIKDGVPLIVGETQDVIETIFKEIASQKLTKVSFADSTYNIFSEGYSNNYNLFKVIETNTQYKLELQGIYQQKNLSSVLLAADSLQKMGLNISSSSITKGLNKVITNTGLKGRWQILQTEPLVVCDIGHNSEGITEIVKQILNQKFDSLRIVLGMVNDKDIAKVIKLLPKDAYYYFTQAKIPRAMAAQELYSKALETGLNGEVIEDVQTAYSEAIKVSNTKDMVFIGGSAFVVAEIDL